MAQYPHLARQYIGKILPLRFFLLLLYVVLTLILALCLNYNEKQFHLLYILIFNQFLISVILYFRSYFSGLLFLKIDILLSVMDKFFLILLMGYFLYFSSGVKISAQLFVWSQTISLGLTLLIALSILLAKIGLPKIKWNLSFNRYILKKSFPYALLIVLMTLYNRVDSIMLERMLTDGSYQAGIYAQAYRLLDALFMFAGLFSSLLFPLFARMLKEGQKINGLLSLAGNILLPGAILIALVCFFDGNFILSLIYNRDISEAESVFRILMFSFIPVCVTLLFGTLLTVNGNLKFLNWISFGGILVNTGLNYVLIPDYGALGATYASLGTQSVVALAQIIYALRLFKINFDVRLFLKYFSLIVILLSIPFALDSFQLKWNKSLSMISIGVLVLLVSRLLDWKSFLQVLKQSRAKDAD